MFENIFYIFYMSSIFLFSGSFSDFGYLGYLILVPTSIFIYLRLFSKYLIAIIVLLSILLISLFSIAPINNPKEFLFIIAIILPIITLFNLLVLVVYGFMFLLNFF